MQLHGNLLDKETLPRAASTEFCLAKQLLQCWSRTGIWSTMASVTAQNAETRAHRAGGEWNTQGPVTGLRES